MGTEKRKRQQVIKIRVDAAEAALIDRNRAMAGSKSVPDYLRRRGLGWQPHMHGPIVIEDRDELRRLKISVGLAASQIARAAEAQQAAGPSCDYSIEIRRALDDLRAVNDRIRAALGYPPGPGDKAGQEAAPPPQLERAG